MTRTTTHPRVSRAAPGVPDDSPATLPLNQILAGDCIEVMNALLLPLALGLLILLATRALPEDKRVKGPYKWVVYAVSGVTVAFAMVGVLDGIGLI